ncbi:MAG: hypothetical protein GX654_03080 [Desulfatiglans sp.]|jgi:hypothetical protein|nr:hypothetical protein [Desulfatiglans sp.]
MLIKIVLGVIFVPIALLNLLGPLFVKKVQKLPARIRFAGHDENEFLISRDEEFNRLDSEIKTIGFEYIGSSYMKDTNAETNFSLYTNETDLTCALVVSIISSVKTITYVEFSQLYEDGSMLNIFNSSQVLPFPDMDLKIALRYPDIKSPKELYNVFVRIKNNLKNTARPMAYDKSKGFKHIEDFMARESDDLVKRGYCYNEIDSDGKRSLTLKGAYLLTWRSIFPGSRIRELIDRSYASRILKNLLRGE